jgi:uncharacterized protein YegJ (DUF2314 family)
VSLLKKLFGKKDDYFDGIILLLSEFRIVDTQVAVHLLPPESGRPQVTGGQGDITLKGRDYLLNILSIPAPYGPPGGGVEFLADRCQDLRMKERVLVHKAFVSINAGAQTPRDLRSGTGRQISQLAANMIDDTVLALMDAESGLMMIPFPGMAELLMKGDRQAAFSPEEYNPLVNVKASLADEIAEARRRYPEFVAAFQRAKPDSAFTVKMAFTEDGVPQTEHMWMDPIAVDDGSVTGTLVSDPLYMRRTRKGDRVTKPITELTDWIYAEDGHSVGAFTEAKVRRGG